MSKTKGKILSIILTLAMIISCISIVPSASVSVAAAGDIKVDPTTQYQTMEGWGTAICWWGNLVGTWEGIVTDWSREYGESLNPPVENMEVRDAVIYMLYSPDECNMNVARYIIGGGDGDDGLYSNTFIKRPDSRAIGWSIDLYGYADGTNFGNIRDDFWTKSAEDMQDWGQLYVLDKAAEIREEAMAKEGKPNDLIVETFANSAPYYMTISGHTSGSVTGTSNNLSTSWYTGYAEYMAAVTKWIDNHLQEKFGIGVTATDPFNEPLVGWGGSTNAITGPSYSRNNWPNHFKQEGMYVSTTNQSTVINCFTKAFEDFDITHIPLTTSGETNQTTQVSTWNALTESAKAETGIISTHSYGYSAAASRNLRDHAASRDAGIWQAEVGFGPGTNAPWNPYSMNLTNTMNQSACMINDLKYMGCTTWVNWIAAENIYQMAAEGTNWGLIHINLGSPVGKKNFTTGEVTIDPNDYTDVFGKLLKDPEYYNRLLYNYTTGDDTAHLAEYPEDYGKWKEYIYQGSGTSTRVLNYTEPEDYEVHYTKQLYVQKQFSNFIKQGYTIIDMDSLGITNTDAVAAISPDRTELIIEAKNGSTYSSSNPSGAVATTSIDLSAFPNATTAEVYCTMDDVDDVEWNCAQMDDIDVSSGTLNVSLPWRSVVTYKITSKNGLPLFEDNITYEIVNTEAMYAMNTGTTDTARSNIQAYVDTGRYNDINKFNYKRADGSYNGSNISSTTTVSTGWSYVTSGMSSAYSASVRRASADGASASFKFEGDRLILMGQTLSTGGTFSVSVDGVDKGTVSTVSSTTDYNAVLYDTGILLSNGTHEVEITKVGSSGTVAVSAAKIGTMEENTLLTLANKCYSLNEAYYTEASWATMDAALTGALVVLNNEDATESQINGAYNKLAAAYAGLVTNIDPGAVNKTVLAMYIEMTEEILATESAILRPSSVKVLQDTLILAKYVYNSPYAAQEMVDDIAYDLLWAIVNRMDIVDKTDLNELIAIIEGLDSSKYKEAGWTALAEALANAKLIDDESKVVEVTNAYKALQEAFNGLELIPVTNKNALRSALNNAKAILDDINSFVPSSVAGLADLYAQAQAVYDSADSTQDQVSSITNQLVVAIAKARAKADTTALVKALAQASSLKAANYTSASYAALASEMKAAQAVVGNVEVTQAEVDKETTALNNAINGLVPVAASVKVSGLSKNMVVGETATAKATVTPSNADKTVKWTSSDSKVASINASTGKVTAKSAGKATITATASGKTATYTITVHQYVSMKIGSTKAIQNGNKVTIDNAGTKPFKIGGRTMIPVRFVGEKMGGKVKYVSDSQPITMTYGDITVELKLGSKSMKVIQGGKSKTVTLDVAAQKKNGKTYIPLRAISESLGFAVYYEAGSEYIVVNSPAMSADVRNARLTEAKGYIK